MRIDSHSPQDPSGLVQSLRDYFATGVTRPLPVREAALKRLHEAIRRLEGPLLEALGRDLGKPAAEAFMTEIVLVHREIEYFLANLETWARPEQTGRSIDTMMGKGEILRVPLGTVLIIAPTNYPVQLALMPLIAAVAAGNTVLIRMSGTIPRVNEVLRRIIRLAFRPGHVELVDGSEDPDRQVTRQRFDLIFFTGSAAAGRKVLTQASTHLTPVILELGGQNPVIVLRDADVVAAARKIAWGKFVNAGQTCIAPNQVYVHYQVRTALSEELKRAIHEFYGADPKTSASYSRIGSQRHFQRLRDLLTPDLNIQAGGQTDTADRYIAPTLVDDVPADHPLLQEEIFGPILPILEYRDINQLIRELRSREKPLAAYVFGQDEGFARQVLERIPSGGGCINDTLIHVSAQTLPFGGVGQSGMGNYHGRFGFEAFSQRRSIVTGTANLVNTMLYPPYSGWKTELLRRYVSRKVK